MIFPSLAWAIKSTEFAEKELEREIQKQFRESGINFEGSLPYHRLSSEICLIGVALLKKRGRDVPAGIVERLRKAADFTQYYTDTCEECPTIGDNDNGIVGYAGVFKGIEDFSQVIISLSDLAVIKGNDMLYISFAWRITE